MSKTRQFTITVNLNEEEYATVQREIERMHEIATDVPWTNEQMLVVMVSHGIRWTDDLDRELAKRRTK